MHNKASTMIEQTEEQMRLRVASDYRKFMNTERKDRLNTLMEIPMGELTPAEGDQLYGIATATTNFLRLMDAHTVDSAFTAEGLLYQTLMRIQFNLLKTPSWRGGEEDHSPVSKIITL